MLFSSNFFLFLFLPIVLFIYYIILHNIVLRNIFLLLVSLIFYAWGEPYFVLIMLLSITGNYWFAIWINHYKHKIFQAKLCLIGMICFNLSIFFIFKYLPFSITTINSLLQVSFHVPQIKLPIGISFFTFQAMSYVFDVYRGKGVLQKNPLYVGLYISFFPQLVAGPIVRYQTIAEQILHRKNTISNFTDGICRFIIGLSKKVLLANTLALVADKAFAINTLGELSVALAWLGMVAYSLQIFYDFSGYSDMAIGLGKMFGFHFEENFNYPYFAKSITDFWRRWHISLSTWFRDYVYIPLGGSRNLPTKRIILNLFIVWSLTGIWHGANWTFLCWGLFYFLLLCYEKFILPKITFRQKIPTGIAYIATLLCVGLGWVLFRADTLTQAGNHVLALFGLTNNTLYNPIDIFLFYDNIFYFSAAFFFAIPVIPYIKKLKTTNTFFCIITELSVTFFYIILFTMCVSSLVKGTHNPFIYFNF